MMVMVKDERDLKKVEEAVAGLKLPSPLQEVEEGGIEFRMAVAFERGYDFFFTFEEWLKEVEKALKEGKVVHVMISATRIGYEVLGIVKECPWIARVKTYGGEEVVIMEAEDD